MLTIDGNKIVLTRGDSAEIELTLTDAQGETYDYSDDTVTFGIKRSVYDKDCVLTKTVENGKISFEPSDTETLEYGDYLYDIEVRHTVEAESEEEEDTVQVYTPIAAAKFTLGYNVL